MRELLSLRINLLSASEGISKILVTARQSCQWPLREKSTSELCLIGGSLESCSFMLNGKTAKILHKCANEA